MPDDMIAAAPPADAAQPAAARRTRPRTEGFKYDAAIIATRVDRFYRDDLLSRADELEARLQRYAKYRLWTEGKDWPWEGCSDFAVPDMSEKSLRVQDTLHNAVMAQTPPIGSKALSEGDREKEKLVDNLIAFQVFAEQPGELKIGELIEAFVNDGVFTAFIPWVTEKREVVELRTFGAIDPQTNPLDFFRSAIAQAFPNVKAVPQGDGWDWQCLPQDPGEVPFTACFYTRDDGTVEMCVEKETVVFDGPHIRALDWEDVLHPPRAANLQMPGPSNPGGASHTIIRDYPAIDEIKRLAKSGYYQIADADLTKLDGLTRDKTDEAPKEQKDALAGTMERPAGQEEKSQATLTRLTCFDSYDIDDDGLDEDVIWWYLLEPKLVIRARRLTEQYPANPPRRPFAEAAMIPVPGRRKGISMLEITEGIHDIMKSTFDQMVDAGTLTMSPSFFYRATSTLKQEVIRMWPGEGYPLADPKNDIYFPQLPNTAQINGINLLTLLGQMEERLTVIGDLQLGRVPSGKSSALRTAAAFSLLQSQGEARPERILRRFFTGLTEIWAQIHELNRVFLPDDKKIRIIGSPPPEQDPYQTITRRAAIDGRFQFGFNANVLNTSKAALADALESLIQTYVTPLAIQLGISNPSTIYQLMRDYGRARGQDADRYLAPPTPDDVGPKILAEEAIQLVLKDEMPGGSAAEAGGYVEHLQKLIAFIHTDEFGHLNATQVGIFKAYITQVAPKAQQQQQKEQMLKSAAATAAMHQGGGQPGAPLTQIPQSPGGNPQLSGGGEMLDESMPGAGGGANTGGPQ